MTTINFFLLVEITPSKMIMKINETHARIPAGDHFLPFDNVKPRPVVVVLYDPRVSDNVSLVNTGFRQQQSIVFNLSTTMPRGKLDQLRTLALGEFTVAIRYHSVDLFVPSFKFGQNQRCVQMLPVVVLQRHWSDEHTMWIQNNYMTLCL